MASVAVGGTKSKNLDPGGTRPNGMEGFPNRKALGGRTSRRVRSNPAHLISKIGDGRDPCDFGGTRMISGVATLRQRISRAHSHAFLIFFVLLSISF